MEEGRSSKKRKPEWEGGNMHTVEKEGKKKQKKTKEEKKKKRKASALASSSRDPALLKLHRRENQPKIYGEEGAERSKGVFEHNHVQEDGYHDVHVDCSAFSHQPRQQPKKVRFSDQFAPCTCKQNVSDEVCTHNSCISEESVANAHAGQSIFAPSCGCNKDDAKEEPARDNSANTNACRVGKVLDQEGRFTRKRQNNEDDEVWGRRFTPEEDELLKNAFLEYIKVKGWEEKEGIDKVLDCRKHKEARSCWNIIRLCLPHRPRQAIRSRAYRLFKEGTHLGRWSEEEEELLKRLHKEHGDRWKYLSTLIARSQYSICGKWRCLKRLHSSGFWTWDEMQQLSDLVHKCLWLKALGGTENEKASHKFLRDNISWDQIADAMGTRTHASCCRKWYSNLSSPMVIDGLWASEDDFLLLKSLLESGACAEEEVEWHKLLNHRSGQTCFLRWKQMVKYLGENRTRAFLEKLDGLVRRYAPELLS